MKKLKTAPIAYTQDQVDEMTASAYAEGYHEGTAGAYDKARRFVLQAAAQLAVQEKAATPAKRAAQALSPPVTVPGPLQRKTTRGRSK